MGRVSELPEIAAGEDDDGCQVYTEKPTVTEGSQGVFIDGPDTRGHNKKNSALKTDKSRIEAHIKPILGARKIPEVDTQTSRNSCTRLRGERRPAQAFGDRKNPGTSLLRCPSEAYASGHLNLGHLGARAGRSSWTLCCQAASRKEYPEELASAGAPMEG